MYFEDKIHSLITHNKNKLYNNYNYWTRILVYILGGYILLLANLPLRNRKSKKGIVENNVSTKIDFSMPGLTVAGFVVTY